MGLNLVKSKITQSLDMVFISLDYIITLRYYIIKVERKQAHATRKGRGKGMRDRIIAIAKEAIKNGFGDYYALYKTTWRDILAGYEAGKRVDDVSEGVLLRGLGVKA